MHQQTKTFGSDIIGSLFDMTVISNDGPPKLPIIIPDNMVEIKTEAQKELGLSTIPTEKEISKDKYKSDNILQPKSAAEHNKYVKIYVDYVSSKGTQIELAKKYGISNVHMNRIIKYATFQMGEPDSKADLQSLVDGLEHRKVKIQEEIDGTMEIDEKVKLYTVMNKTDSLLAKLQGLMSTALIDMSQNNQTVVVKYNSEMKRRTGDKIKGDDAKVLEVKPDDVDGLQGYKKNDGDMEFEQLVEKPFKRRTGSDKKEPVEIK